jgi:segregation and condensation protein B
VSEGRVVPFPGGATREGDVPPALIGAVEAVLFAAGAPVTADDVANALETGVADVEAALHALAGRAEAPDRGVELVRIGGGWQLRTRSMFAAAVLRLRGGKPAKLSRPALEVLAVVAYRQPVTRPEIEAIRGVDSGGVLKTLLEKELVRVAGRREEAGRPLEYGTTAGFLELFSLSGLGALPTLREREELVRDRETPPE